MYCDTEKDMLNHIMPSASGDGLMYYDYQNYRFVFEFGEYKNEDEFEKGEWFLKEFDKEFYCKIYGSIDEYTFTLLCVAQRINNRSMYFKNIEVEEMRILNQS